MTKLNKDSTLFNLLKMLSSNELINYDYNDDDINKNLNKHIFMLSKYIFGCDSEESILLFNEYANKYIFNIKSTHNELIYKLMSIIRLDNRSKNYKWQYPKKNKS